MASKQPFIIGICGGSGSGKSTLAQAVAGSFPAGTASLLTLDSYYHPRAEFPAAIRGNFDHPDSLDAALLVQHLQALRAGETVSVPVYDFTVHDRKARTVSMRPAPVMILDGILLFALPGVAEQLDVSIYVDVPADVRLARRLLRDTRERGRSLEDVLEQYLSTVRPMHELFVEAFKQQADLRVSGMDDLQDEVESVLAWLDRRGVCR